MNVFAYSLLLLAGLCTVLLFPVNLNAFVKAGSSGSENRGIYRLHQFSKARLGPVVVVLVKNGEERVWLRVFPIFPAGPMIV